MDTTETYIKMCEKAKEIQEHKVGHVMQSLRTDQNIDKVTSVWVTGRAEYYTGYYLGLPHEIIIWLPRQDQLQEMICWNITGRFGVLMIDGLMQFAKEFYKPVSFCDDSVTWEQLWLAFMMKRLYSKIWNGEKWTQ